MTASDSRHAEREVKRLEKALLQCTERRDAVEAQAGVLALEVIKLEDELFELRLAIAQMKREDE